MLPESCPPSLRERFLAWLKVTSPPMPQAYCPAHRPTWWCSTLRRTPLPGHIWKWASNLTATVLTAPTKGPSRWRGHPTRRISFTGSGLKGTAWKGTLPLSSASKGRTKVSGATWWMKGMQHGGKTQIFQSALPRWTSGLRAEPCGPTATLAPNTISAERGISSHGENLPLRANSNRPITSIMWTARMYPSGRT